MNISRKITQITIAGLAAATLLAGQIILPAAAAEAETEIDTDQAEIQSAESSDKLAERKESADLTDAIYLNVENNELTAEKNGNSMKDSELEEQGITFDDQTLSITSAGTYVLSGELNGKVEISASKSEDVILVLNGLTVINETEETLSVKKVDRLTLVLMDGSQNVLTSGIETEINDASSETASQEDGAALNIKADTVITGNGSLTVNGYLHNGLQVNKNLTVESGSLTVTAVNHAVKVKDTVTVNGGTIKILAGADGIQAETEEEAAVEEVTDESSGEVLTQAQEATEAAGTVEINAGEIDIDAYGDAIQANLALTVNGGQITVKTEGEDASGNGDSFAGRGGGSGFLDFLGFGSESQDTVSTKGLKSDGTLDISGGEIIAETSDDALHSAGILTISGGTITIRCGDDGIHSDTEIGILDGEITISKSYEGIEANQISVSGGTISVVSSDDGFNANGGSDSFGGPGGFGGFGGFGQNSSSGETSSQETPNLNISGGTIYVNASGDGLDSNGNITISGGMVIVDGPSDSANGAIDGGTENGGTITISGGTIFAGGASGMAETFDSSSEQCSFCCNLSANYETGTEIIVKSSDGTEIFRHTTQSSGNSIVFSAAELQQGESCLLIVGESEYEIALSGISSYVTAAKDGTVTESNENANGFGGFGGGGMPGGKRNNTEFQDSDTNGSSPQGKNDGGEMPAGNSPQGQGKGETAGDAPQTPENGDEAGISPQGQSNGEMPSGSQQNSGNTGEPQTNSIA